MSFQAQKKNLATLLALLALSCLAGCQKPPVVAQFYSDNSSITAGEATSLHWSVSGADSVILRDNYDTSLVASDNSCVVNPSKTTSYTLVASNKAGSENRTVVVSIDWVTTGDLLGKSSQS